MTKIHTAKRITTNEAGCNGSHKRGGYEYRGFIIYKSSERRWTHIGELENVWMVSEHSEARNINGRGRNFGKCGDTPLILRKWYTLRSAKGSIDIMLRKA